MAKYERTVSGNFSAIVNTLHNAVMNGSVSASLEDESDLSNGPFRCLMRVYERYSWFGGNRVSMTIVVAGTEGKFKVTAITAGGSEGIFFKLNRVGEKSFLNTVIDAIEQL